MIDPMTAGRRLVRVGHSPDPDDAFMFYALVKGKVVLEGMEFKEVVEPIDDLNRRALAGELEITALSAHTWARCGGRYWILSAGASIGRGYGPLLVATRPMALADLTGRTVALPGELTTAALVARMILPGAVFVHHRFDEIPEVVRSGRADAGVLIHEGQLTYGSLGLVKLLDFGVWWAQSTGGLPLPLGLDAVRADLGLETALAMNRALVDSIRWSFDHPEEAMEYARGFGRGIAKDVNQRFVKMYVNEDTLKLPDDAVAALKELFGRAARAGWLPALPDVKIIG